MSHSLTTVQLGTTRSSVKEVINHAGAIAAGKLVHLKSDDTITTASADGQAIGISLGTGMSDTSRTAIVSKGVSVPLLCTAAFTPTIGAQVNIDDVTGHAKAAGSGVTAYNAVYSAASLTAIDEVGTTNALAACLIDFPGGL